MEPKTPKPLKKLNIFSICFIILFLVVFTYVEFTAKLESIYWTMAKYAAILLIFIITTILRRVRNKEHWVSLIIMWGCWLAMLAMWGWRDISKYKNKLCLDKFGTEFNQRRQKLGIPILPAGWRINSVGSRSIDWINKDSTTTGHFAKSSLVDSLCALEYEEDGYNLKSSRGIARHMSVLIWFDNKKRTDTIKYNYDVGDSTKTITRQQADSIFAAEKIQKDY